MIRTALVTVVAAAALAWLAGSGTALAPEPAQLLVDLTAGQGTGTSASARFVNSEAATSVVKFPASWTPGYAWLVAGTPCSTTELGAYQTTAHSIQASGNYRRCV